MASAMDTVLDRVLWRKVEWETPPEGDLPYVTHEGELSLLGQTLKVMVLSDGKRIIAADDVEQFFALAGMPPEADEPDEDDTAIYTETGGES